MGNQEGEDTLPVLEEAQIRNRVTTGTKNDSLQFGLSLPQK